MFRFLLMMGVLFCCGAGFFIRRRMYPPPLVDETTYNVSYTRPPNPSTAGQSLNLSFQLMNCLIVQPYWCPAVVMGLKIFFSNIFFKYSGASLHDCFVQWKIHLTMAFSEWSCASLNDFPYARFLLNDFGTMLHLTMTVLGPLVSLNVFFTAPFLLFLKYSKMFKKCLKCLESLVHLIKPSLT